MASQVFDEWMDLRDEMADQMQQLQLETYDGRQACMLTDTAKEAYCAYREATVVNSPVFRFRDLPGELRTLVYEFFFGNPVFLYHLSPRHHHRNESQSLGWMMDSHLGDELDKRNDIANLLCANRATYCEAAPLLYKSARMLTGMQGIYRMITRKSGGTLASSQLMLYTKIRVKPELLIRSLTIQAYCAICESERNDISARDREKSSRLKVAIASLEKNFPRLEKVVIVVNEYSDLMASGTIPRMVSPFCCLRRIKDIQFVAKRVEVEAWLDWFQLFGFLERTTGSGRSQNGISTSRLRMEDTILKALGDVFSGRCHVEGTKHLHEEGRCIYRGLGAGEMFLKDILARVLKEEYHVKTQTLA